MTEERTQPAAQGPAAGAPAAEAPVAETPGEPSTARPAVENRWWVDSGSAKRPPSVAAPPRAPESPDGRPVRVVGERLFRAGRDFDQDRAKARLTDSNLNWIKEANPPQDGWAQVNATEGRSRDDLVARVKQSIRLPRGARAVLIDSGTSLRVVATGLPVGARIVEITLGAESSLDAWSGGDWVGEHVYRGRDRALREASKLLARYLAPAD